jgi:hypothetical protein
MPEGQIDMKSRFTILLSTLSASLWTTLAPATAQDAGGRNSIPVQTASTNATPPLGLDPASARELKHEYRRLAEIGTKAAQAADDLADYHSGLAESIRNIRAESVRSNSPFSSLGK